MQNHKGTVKFKYSPKEKKLFGGYFNSFGNQGDMTYELEGKDKLYCFK